MRLPYLCAVGLVLLNLAPAVAGDAGRWTLQTEVRGVRIEGMPLAWSTKDVFLLGRDGRLWDFSPSAANHFRKVSSDFHSYSAAELRTMLERELAGQLE